MFRVEQMNLFVVNIDQATNLNNKYRTPRRSTRPWRFYDLFSKSADICILKIAVITFRSSWSVLIMSTPNPIFFFFCWHRQSSSSVVILHLPRIYQNILKNLNFKQVRFYIATFIKKKY